MSPELSLELESLLKNHKKFLVRLLQATSFGQDVFLPDSRTAAYMQGRQSVGSDLCRDLATAHPDQFAKLISEVYNERNQ